MADFHEIRFPTSIALGARGGPERRTEVVTLASGREHRNARWAHARRRYDAGFGVKSLDELAQVVEFFEERRGRLHGFRWHDRLDGRSCPPSGQPTAFDQQVGVGDGSRTTFQLTKTYGAAHAPYVRTIAKPVAGTVRLAVGGIEQAASAFSADAATGMVHVVSPPPPGAAVSVGFLFDVPVRFDADRLDVDLGAFAGGDIPQIPVIEILV